jgi:hypothetical protein
VYSPLPPQHLNRNWAHPCHICTGTGLTPAIPVPTLGSPDHIALGFWIPWIGLGSLQPHLHRDSDPLCRSDVYEDLRFARVVISVKHAYAELISTGYGRGSVEANEGGKSGEITLWSVSAE